MQAPQLNKVLFLFLTVRRDGGILSNEIFIKKRSLKYPQVCSHLFRLANGLVLVRCISRRNKLGEVFEKTIDKEDNFLRTYLKILRFFHN